MHGPCGIDNPGAPCMEADQCKKMFPKEFRTETTMNVSVYPLYRRCPSDTKFVRGREMDNRYVLPYNLYLLLKYNMHINVEVCTSLRAVKYIYIFTKDLTAPTWFCLQDRSKTMRLQTTLRHGMSVHLKECGDFLGHTCMTDRMQ
ncbi:hypothetical protein AVEN_6878-1 [Araneus ventricosus]|uniref:Helitron helicase-like domain-containing protein n=1 Tax=Araneus ventricosus TaxID=182803 RepID=A0A4Y2UWG3_ARAVE|nr:hypothetical protein AVEN_6878-1 [Araneus ventricosus]